MDRETIDAPVIEEESAERELFDSLAQGTSQTVEDLAELIIEHLLGDERLKKLFSQPQNNDQRRGQRLLRRQKNKEQAHLLLEDLVAQDNSSLASTIRTDKFAKEYLQVVDTLYRELEAEYDDFPIKDSTRNSYLRKVLTSDSWGFKVLMRIEVFMLMLLHQQITPAFLYSKGQISQVAREKSGQLEQRVTRLGREFLFLWNEMDFIKELAGNYFTRNVLILSDFFREEDPSKKRFTGFNIKKRDANVESLEELNDLFIQLANFAKSGKYQPNTMDRRPRSGDIEPINEIVRPSHILITKDWNKRSQQLQAAIDYFQRYKRTNIVLYRFKIQLELENDNVRYDQFQKFFGVLNKKAVKPQGFEGYLDFLYFWKENFTTQDLIQDMIIIMDASTLIKVPEQNNEKASLRDIPAEFFDYMQDTLSENLEIFENQTPVLRFDAVPVMQGRAWNMPAELIIEAGDKAKRAFFENRILPYFIYLEIFDVDYTDPIKNRFKRGQKS